MIVVIGAGAAGLGTAISVASHNKAVILIEKTSRLGGTVTQSLIHTLGGLYDAEGNMINDGLPQRLARLLFEADPKTHKRRIGRTWTLTVAPAVYEQVVERWLSDYANLNLFRNSHLTDIQTENGQVKQVDLTTPQETIRLNPQAIVDATGTAEVVRFMAPHQVIDSPVLAGLILQVRGVPPTALKFPKSVAYIRQVQQAVEAGTLPPECNRVWLDSGVAEDELYIKLNFLATKHHTTDCLQQISYQLISFLQKNPDFSQAYLTRIGRLGIRDGGRIKGEYVLQAEDVRQGRKFPDAVARCCWPIEYWSPEKGVTLEYLPEGQSYDIPAGSLRVLGMKNVWAVGKILSAEPLAQASARVAGTCWAMGDGLGRILAQGKEQ